MAKILVVVMNNVTFDARVLRQARALRARGHEITILGERTTPTDLPFERRTDGLVVHRLGRPRPPRRRMSSTHKAAEQARTTSQSVVASPSAAAGAPAIEPRRGWRLGQVPASTFGLLHSGAPLATSSFLLRRWVRDQRFVAAATHLAADLVHVHDVGALPLGVALARARGVPLIFDAHEIYDQDHSSPRHRAKSERDAYLIARHAAAIDGFITVNASLAAYYAEHFAALPPAVVLPNAAPVVDDMLDDGRLHAASGLAPAMRVLLYQGMLNGGRYLAELAASVPLLPDDWAVVCMGEGPLKAKLESIRADLPEGQRHRLVVLEPAPPMDLVHWSAGASLGFIALEPANLNFWFSSPNRLWSYPQAGIPFLASPFPELQRAVTTYGCGFELAAPVTPARIAAAVASLGPADLAAARDGCRRFMAVEGWQAHEPSLVALYDRLLGPACASGGARAPTSA